MNATTYTETCDDRASVLQWVALGWILLSELLPLVGDDTMQANGVLHGIQLCVQNEHVRKLFTARDGHVSPAAGDSEHP